MEQRPIPEFEKIMSKLSKDLEEFESLSQQFRGVQNYAKKLREFDTRFSESLKNISVITQKIIASFSDNQKNLQDNANKVIASVKSVMTEISNLNSEITKSVVGIENELNAIKEIDFPGKLEQLEDDINNIREHTKKTQLKTDEIQKSANEAFNSISKQTEELVKLENRVNDTVRAVTLLEASVKQQKDNLQETRNSIIDMLSQETKALANLQKETMKNFVDELWNKIDRKVEKIESEYSARHDKIQNAFFSLKILAVAQIVICIILAIFLIFKLK
ncbi:MAG: hypothetical protein H8E46_02265 [FCB group bacterium]|nr:hypothetical protein [FCB group bacterium]